MNIKDLAEMIDIAFGISLTLGGILWMCLYFKVDKIYDELKEIRKEKKDVKHGEWIDEYGVYRCSCCNENALVVGDQYLNTFEYRSDFCPYCGADMRGEK